MKDNRAELLKLWEELSDEGRQIITNCAIGLVASGNYKKPLPIFTSEKGKVNHYGNRKDVRTTRNS